MTQSDEPGGEISHRAHLTQAHNLLMSLDRCPHGRHALDRCYDCPGGQSAGNPHLRPGTIGYTVHGHPITLPAPDDIHDITHWTRP